MCRICAVRTCCHFSGFDLAVFLFPFESVLSASASVRQCNCIFSCLRSVIVKCQRIAFVHRVDELAAACPVSRLHFHLPLTITWIFYVLKFQSLCFKRLCISIRWEFKAVVFCIHLFFKCSCDRMSVCQNFFKCICSSWTYRFSVYNYVLHCIAFVRFYLKCLRRTFFHFHCSARGDCALFALCYRCSDRVFFHRNFFRCHFEFIKVRRSFVVCCKDKLAVSCCCDYHIKL